MDHTTSADGTRIAYERHGEGPPVVIVGGAMSTADAGAPLATALAAVGLQGVTMDRRARGESGDTAPYAPEREADDIAAVIDAVGGEAAVFGHSSGAVLSLFAASVGVHATRLFLSEPPFHFDEEQRDPNLPDRLQSLVDDDRGAEAITTFQRDAVGLPEPVIEQIQNSPMFPALVTIAQSVVYDAILTYTVTVPTAEMLAVDAPVTILRGDPTFPTLMRACDELHAAMPGSELVVDSASSDHALNPPSIAEIVRSRL